MSNDVRRERCRGCRKTFVQLRRHQQHQAHYTSCYRALQQSVQEAQRTLGLDDGDDNMRNAMDHDGRDPLGGDFFGNYEMADFGDLRDGDIELGSGGEDAEGDASDEESGASEDEQVSDNEGRDVLREVVVERRAAQARLQYRPQLVEKFNDTVPGAEAGKVYNDDTLEDGEEGHSAYACFAEELRTSTEVTGVYAPFMSKMDWEIARWAKTRGPGSTALDELLKIGGVADALGLSYRSSRELNAKIDKHIPSRRPAFLPLKVSIGDREFEFFARNTMECIRALFGAPEFASKLILRPERHYADKEGHIPVYHDMHTGEWWWRAQEAIEDDKTGGTVVPLIMSLDKTQVTLFRMKSVYPVYLTIGNIPKDIRKKPSRHAQVLLAYLPTARLTDVTNMAGRRRMLLNIVHACLRHILREVASLGGTGTLMKDGNGRLYRCHPILASLAIDYQEQVQIAGIINGDCAKCYCPNDKLGEHWEELDPERDVDDVFDVLDLIDSEDPSQYYQQCKENRIKPIQHPFWIDLPYCNIFDVIAPDILHQLHQGVVKHLVQWLKDLIGGDILDKRCRCIPPNHSIRIFHMGLSVLRRVTGKEHGQICQFVLGLLIGFKLRDPSSTRRLVCMTRAVLDFVYIAQYPIHTTETLELLQDALRRIHENKQVFIDEGIRSDFNFVKMHSMIHYFSSIKLRGTTDNCNTQFSERLHIDLAKDAYAATNKKDEIPQMTRWLERKEKVFDLTKNITWQTHSYRPTPPWRSPELIPELEVSTAKKPKRRCSMDALAQLYGANHFEEALSRYAVSLKEPNMRPNNITAAARFEIIAVRSVGVYEKVKFRDKATDGYPVVDSIHASAARSDKLGRFVPARFDTALVRVRDGTNIQAFRVAQVRVIFSLNKSGLAGLLANENLQRLVPSRLAYVEWFTKFAAEPASNFRMYKVSRSFNLDGSREFGIVPVADLHRSAHLIPDFGQMNSAQEWTSDNVLEKSKDFYLNDFKDRSTHFGLF